MVYLMCQRYKFKSKSQPENQAECIVQGVFDVSKIQI